MMKIKSLVIISIALFTSAAVSLLIPLFSSVKSPMPSIVNPSLYPFYYQTNSDAPVEIRTALGFPEVFRTESYRVNRPLVYGIIAGIRNTCISPMAHGLVPEKLKSIHWGRYSAIDILMTYFLWTALNILLTFLACTMALRVFAVFFDDIVSLGASLILVTTPIAILGLREIQYGAFELFLIVASLRFWQIVLMSNERPIKIILLSLGIGVLFTGKIAISTFTAGCVLCALSKNRRLLLLIVPLAAIPPVLWAVACTTQGIPFVVSECVNYSAPLGRFAHGFHAHLIGNIIHFALLWCKALWEDTGFIHTPFFAIGLYCMIKSGKNRILLVAALFALVNALFYFTLDRTHAVYGMHTMLFYFPIVALGVSETISFFCKRRGTSLDDRTRFSLMIGIVFFMQIVNNYIVLPSYGG